MAKIEFPDDQKDIIVSKIQRYFNQELEQNIGQFDAEFLLDFFSKEMGSFYYNKGLYDAQTIIASKVDTITDAIYELEQSTNSLR
ncbi:MAG: hypothetical protein ACI808_003331 [Paraglaciecola sp.]|jgi:uncharacterized protein (DUF2164 family)